MRGFTLSEPTAISRSCFRGFCFFSNQSSRLILRRSERVKTLGRVTWRFPKKRGTFLGCPTNKDHSILGLYWGPTISGNCHIGLLGIHSATSSSTSRAPG